jgi:hypothetical protein
LKGVCAAPLCSVRLNSQDHYASADITLVLDERNSVLLGARARNQYAPAVFHRAGLNTTGTMDPKLILCFFSPCCSMLLLVGCFLLLALPASADAGGASLLARRLCRVFSPHTRASSGVKCAKSVPASVLFLHGVVGFEWPLFLRAFEQLYPKSAQKRSRVWIRATRSLR